MLKMSPSYLTYLRMQKKDFNFDLQFVFRYPCFLICICSFIQLQSTWNHSLCLTSQSFGTLWNCRESHLGRCLLV